MKKMTEEAKAIAKAKLMLMESWIGVPLERVRTIAAACGLTPRRFARAIEYPEWKQVFPKQERV